MKKNLSIVMLVLLGIAWYITLSTWLGNEKKYNNLVAEAKRFEEKGLYLDAISQYEEAKRISGEQLTLDEYIADVYLAMGDYKEYRKKLNAIIVHIELCHKNNHFLAISKGCLHKVKCIF